MENQKQLEILAPAGGRPQLEAAVRTGADAVYLGFGKFHARRNAQNFDAASLKDAVSYCHARGVKVHAAFNTLVTESELLQAQEELKQLADAGVDALIIQDIGLVKMARECVPHLALHASTQLTVHNVSGIKMLEKLGFQRAVLARELSLPEIKQICMSTDMEIEVFIHGALCMCVSGGCYLSSVLGARSGNRGLCAQPCRLNFKINGREQALSLKDMSHIQYIQALAEAGVKSFKIEGRMKRPEYVAAAVTACRSALAGKSPDMAMLKAVFSRSGFTDGYITGKRTLDMFGFRRKDDVTAAADVLKETAALYRSERQSISLAMDFTMQKDVPCSLTVTDGIHTVSAQGQIPEAACARQTQEEDILKQLRKTGGTPFYADKITIQADSGLLLSLSQLNKLRRICLDELLWERGKTAPLTFIPFSFSPAKHPPAKERPLRIRALKYAQLEYLPNHTFVILPPEEISKECLLRFPNAAAEIPSLVFPGDEAKTIGQLKELKDFGLRYALCENIGAVFMAQQAGLIPLGGYGLNILNSAAVAEYNRLGVTDITVSFESSKKNLSLLKGDSIRGMISYGYLPLMRMRTCPALGKNGCGNCRGINTVTDRMGIRFTLLCQNKRFCTLLNSLPLYAAGNDFRASDFFMLYFNTETAKEVKTIADTFQHGGEAPMPHTGGLYFKELR